MKTSESAWGLEVTREAMGGIREEEWADHEEREWGKVCQFLPPPSMKDSQSRRLRGLPTHSKGRKKRPI